MHKFPRILFASLKFVFIRKCALYHVTRCCHGISMRLWRFMHEEAQVYVNLYSPEYKTGSKLYKGSRNYTFDILTTLSTR